MKIKASQDIKSDQKITNEEIINLILKSRKITDVKEFLQPKPPLEFSLTDFGYKKEIKKTIELLKKIKKEGQMIVVYTDYDADGITGGAILWETLYLLGFKTMPYVPHRQHEGYGFSEKGLDNVKRQFNPVLIISVDHGITAKDKITYAKKIGINVIVTDHHLKPEKLPTEAKAIFHIPELSGAGVAYYFAKEVYLYFKDSSKNRQLLEKNFSSDYLALATIGVVADLVPLTGVARSVVKYGLKQISKTDRVGIKQILKEAGIDGKPITTYEVGFMIAPRINVVGRLEHAIEALRLLCTNDVQKAYRLASHIGLKNRQRQDMVKESLEEAKKEIFKFQVPISKQTSNLKQPISKMIILVSNKWHEGIIGLIAGKITEKYYRPTIVLTKTDGVYKGSARSITGFDITGFLRSLKKYLIDVGGHKQAAGFTVEEKQLQNFINAAQKKAEKLLTEKILEKTILVDLNMPSSKVSLKLAHLIEDLQPFGIGNPQPTFYSDVRVNFAAVFGKNNNHLKILTNKLELIGFFQADKFIQLSRGQMVRVIYNLEINRWNGSEKLRGKIIETI